MKHQLAIIGGGPAGYTAAECAARAGLSVVLFEKQSLGGVCLNEGCIPTKTLLYSAKTLDAARHVSKYGVSATGASADLPKIIARKQKVVRKLVLGVKAKLTAHGVSIVQGEATIIDQHTVQCGGETYQCDNLIICTGSETLVPPIPGTDTVPLWTHRDALNCKELPASLAIIGGGVIGIEFASFFNSLGVQVSVVEMLDEILPGMDKELSAMLRAEYTKRGVTFILGAKVTSIAEASCQDNSRTAGLCQDDKTATSHPQNTPTASPHQATDPAVHCDEKPAEVQINYETTQGTATLTAHKLLMSVGRRPVTKGFGLENLNLQRTERGNIFVDQQMQTSLQGVYACGDLTGFSLLAHTAVREAEVAVHSIAGKEDAMSYSAIPAVVYTNPEIAAVGQTEEELKLKGIDYKALKLPMAYSGRFVAENEGVNGVCKLLVSGDGTILGAHLLGNPASEIITLAGMAIELKLTTEQWKRTVFPHPTVGEIFKETMG